MKRNFLFSSLILPFLFLTLLLPGCILGPGPETIADDTENILETDAITRAAKPVALDDALAEMYSLMDDIDACEGTRSGVGVYSGRRNIQFVELLGAKQLQQAITRSDEPILDSLLYLVNFVGGGFAVLGADESLASVIALTSAGRISANDFISGGEVETSYTLEDLWVEEDEDYLLGGVQPTAGVSFVSKIILDYAINGWNDPGGRGIDDGTGDNSAGDGGGEGPVTPVIPPGGGGNNGPTYTYEYEWVVDNNTGVLLTTNWHQRSPFHDFIHFFKSNKTTAGCVAIAVMQIMAYHESPACTDLYYTEGDSALKAAIAAEMGIETDTVTWRGLKASDLDENPTDSLLVLPGSRAAAASISLHVGKGVSMWYNMDGEGSSFATPNQAKKYLNRRGYDATRYISYKESKIKSEIKDNNRPVFLGALGDFSHGHAWVLDGWMERHERKIAVRDSDGQRTVVNENVRSQKLVHCNWGWGGSCNGYYVSDAFFNTKNGAEIPDPNGGTQDFYASWWFRTVTVKL